jgi:hypothetical protein
VTKNTMLLYYSVTLLLSVPGHRQEDSTNCALTMACFPACFTSLLHTSLTRTAPLALLHTSLSRYGVLPCFIYFFTAHLSLSYCPTRFTAPLSLSLWRASLLALLHASLLASLHCSLQWCTRYFTTHSLYYSLYHSLYHRQEDSAMVRARARRSRKLRVADR